MNMKEGESSKIKSLIKYLAMTGGREKVQIVKLSFAVSCNISADSWLPSMPSSTRWLFLEGTRSIPKRAKLKL